MGLAIFAEGTDSTDIFETSFGRLWRWLAKRAGATTEPLLTGFSKASLDGMGMVGCPSGILQLRSIPGPRDVIQLERPRYISRERLDIMIERKHRRKGFDRLIIAFDREPRLNVLRRRCRRAEVFMALRNLMASEHLPEKFRAGARILHDAYYTGAPMRSVKTQSVELLVMERVFEDMLLCDEPGLREALGVVGREPRWPDFRVPTPNPDEFIFKRACQCAPSSVQSLVRDSRCRDKHKWAQFVLERLPPESPVWIHPIFTRLQALIT